MQGVSWGGQDDHMCSAVQVKIISYLIWRRLCTLEDAYITIRLAPRHAENVMDIVNFMLLRDVTRTWIVPLYGTECLRQSRGMKVETRSFR